MKRTKKLLTLLLALSLVLTMIPGTALAGTETDAPYKENVWNKLGSEEADTVLSAAKHYYPADAACDVYEFTPGTTGCFEVYGNYTATDPSTEYVTVTTYQSQKDSSLNLVCNKIEGPIGVMMNGTYTAELSSEYSNVATYYVVAEYAGVYLDDLYIGEATSGENPDNPENDGVLTDAEIIDMITVNQKMITLGNEYDCTLNGYFYQTIPGKSETLELTFTDCQFGGTVYILTIHNHTENAGSMEDYTIETIGLNDCTIEVAGDALLYIYGKADSKEHYAKFILKEATGGDGSGEGDDGFQPDPNGLYGMYAYSFEEFDDAADITWDNVYSGFGDVWKNEVIYLFTVGEDGNPAPVTGDDAAIGFTLADGSSCTAPFTAAKDSNGYWTLTCNTNEVEIYNCTLTLGGQIYGSIEVGVNVWLEDNDNDGVNEVTKATLIGEALNGSQTAAAVPDEEFDCLETVYCYTNTGDAAETLYLSFNNLTLWNTNVYYTNGDWLKAVDINNFGSEELVIAAGETIYFFCHTFSGDQAPSGKEYCAKLLLGTEPIDDSGDGDGGSDTMQIFFIDTKDAVYDAETNTVTTTWGPIYNLTTVTGSETEPIFEGYMGYIINEPEGDWTDETPLTMQVLPAGAFTLTKDGQTVSGALSAKSADSDCLITITLSEAGEYIVVTEELEGIVFDDHTRITVEEPETPPTGDDSGNSGDSGGSGTQGGTTGGGGYVPTTPKDEVTNTAGTATTAPSTSVDMTQSTTSKGGETTTTVDQAVADKILESAAANKSEEIVIDATSKTESAAQSTKAAEVALPTETIQQIAEKTEADVTIKTDVAEIKLDSQTLAAVAEQAEGSTVSIVAEKVKEDAKEVRVELKIVCSEGKTISDFNGGGVSVTVQAPKGQKNVVCVYIDEQGHMHKVPGQLNADGTYTFTTGHFSVYAIMTAEDADAAIAQQKAAVKEMKFKLKSRQVTLRNGKKAVKVTWDTGSDLEFDGVAVYRSTKKNSGYGKKPFFTTEGDAYYNTAIKAGQKYYYKVRGFVYIDGEKVYTDYSYKAWRTVK